jgi:hypothetical protein
MTKGFGNLQMEGIYGKRYKNQIESMDGNETRKGQRIKDGPQAIKKGASL